MAAKTMLSLKEFDQILSNYSLGTLLSAEPVSQGTVQTNYIIWTTLGKFIFRLYENRSEKSVLFEIDVLLHLQTHHYPSPAPIPNHEQQFVGKFNKKPYVIFSFLEGAPLTTYQESHKQQLIQKAAELQNLTLNINLKHRAHRWNYTPDLCRQLALAKAQALNTAAAYEKFKWLDSQLHQLRLPDSLPKAICHCDFHFSNILFKDSRLTAVLDFDDANRTYSTFDLVCLVEGWGWHYPDKELNLTEAAKVVNHYCQHRSLIPLEEHHFFDVYKLSILIDCLWVFARGSGEEFYERQKIEFMNNLGRDQFKDAIFNP